MRKRSAWQVRLLLIAAILAVASMAGWFWSTPRLMAYSPREESGPVQAGDSLRLEFSRRMQTASIENALTTDPPRSGATNWEGNTLVFTPHEPWPSGEVVQVNLAAGAPASGFPQLRMPEGASWRFNVDEPRLAYLYPANGPSEIYSLNLQNGEIDQLTGSPGGVLDYDINATGTAIYFNTDQGNGGTTLYQLDRKTGESRVLLVCEQALCRYPQISPDERSLAYERTELGAPLEQDHPQVWLLSLESGEAALAAEPTHTTEQPQWSPDGLLSYYDRDLLAFVVRDAQGRVATQFPSQTGIAGDWSPDGRFFLFPEIYLNEVSQLTNLESVSSSRLLRFGMDASRVDLTGSDDVEDASPAFSTDGAWITFGRKFLDLQHWTPGRQIWIMSVDGEAGRALTDEPLYNHYDFTWSPDGTQIAYARFNKNVLTEPPEIWIMNADGSGATRLISGGYLPQWLP